MSKRQYRRHIKNFAINPKLQIKLLLPIVILAVTLAGVLDMVYYFTFFRFSMLAHSICQTFGLQDASGADFIVSGTLVHMMIVTVLVTLITIAAISAALIVQTHQILGPLIPITRHVRRLIEGNYNEELIIRKDDKLHDLVRDLNELTSQLRSKRR